jgi:tetratricopeptide (TPR) repeat protein
VYREVAPILRALPMAGLLVVPGVAGLIALGYSKRRPLARRLAWIAVTFALGFLPFFVVGRYRAPWLLLLAPFAAFAIVRVARTLRQRAWKEAAIVVVAAAATILAITRPIAPAPGTGFQYMAFARASLMGGHREAAAHWCERAALRDPSAMDAVALLARLRREDRRFDDAEQVLTRGLAGHPRDSALWLELGRVRLATGRAQAAIDALHASIDGDPRSIPAWSSLTDALHAAGREADAASASRSLEVIREAGGG